MSLEQCLEHNRCPTLLSIALLMLYGPTLLAYSASTDMLRISNMSTSLLPMAFLLLVSQRLPNIYCAIYLPDFQSPKSRRTREDPHLCLLSNFREEVRRTWCREWKQNKESVYCKSLEFTCVKNWGTKLSSFERMKTKLGSKKTDTLRVRD